MATRLVKRIMVFLLLQAAVISLLHLPLYIHRTKYSVQLAYLDKLERLQSLEGERIVFLGDSNTYYGIDSEQVENYFRKPVTNLSIQRATGFHFSMQAGDDLFRAGDIVLMNPSYPGEYFPWYDEDFNGEGAVILETIEAAPMLARWFSKPPQVNALLRDLPDSLRRSLDYLRKALTGSVRTFDPYLTRGQYSKHGDVVAHIDEPSRVTPDKLLPWPDVPPDMTAIRTMRSYAERWRSRGVRVFVTFQPMVDSVFNDNRSKVERLWAAIQAELSDFVIGRPHDFLFPIEEFFDNQRHLLRNSRRARTATVIRQMEQAGIRPESDASTRPTQLQENVQQDNQQGPTP